MATSTTSRKSSHLPPPRFSRRSSETNGDGGKRNRNRLSSVLVAAADKVEDLLTRRRAAAGPSGRTKVHPDRARQDLAWEMYDRVGELREAVRMIADAANSADLFVGRREEGDRSPRRVIEDEESEDGDETPLAPEGVEAVDRLLRGLIQSGVLRRMATQLLVSAETTLIGVPEDLDRVKPRDDDDPDRLSPVGEPEEPDAFDEQMLWYALSYDEVKLPTDDQTKGRRSVDDDETMEILLDGEWHEVLVDRIIAIFIWQDHPRRSDRLDSGVLSALPILLQLVAVHEYATATLDSRLAGAGVFEIPHSVLSLPAGATEEEVEEALDSFLGDLTTAMVTPIEDRSDASAVVPIVVTVPDESTGKMKHHRFDLALTGEINEREEHLIRRLARALDLPPEQLLGMAESNHWTAWQVDEATVKAHVEPLLETLVAPITEMVLWPTLEGEDGEGGIPREEARKWAVGADTTELILRPNRAVEALQLHERGALSDEALRRSTGFDPEDAPEEADAWSRAIEAALLMVQQAPTLAQTPGIRILVEGIYSLEEPPEEGEQVDTTAVEGIEIVPEGEIPEDDDEPSEPESSTPIPDTR